MNFLSAQLAQQRVTRLATSDVPDGIWWILLAVVAIVLLIVFILLFNYIGLYVQALVSGARVSLLELIGMQLRKVNPRNIVTARIQSARAGLNVDQRQMESHVLAGGNLMRVINAMIAATKAGIELPWDTATAIDLAGRDIYEAIRTSVLPKVIDVPSVEMGRSSIDAVAKDGIQLKVRAPRHRPHEPPPDSSAGRRRRPLSPVSVKALSRASAARRRTKWCSRTRTRSVAACWKKGLDANTAFEIVSIDIADVDVGENIDAKLQTDQAEADKKVAQAQAEKRRALAVAQEQENIAEVAKNRALVVLAEAEVPKAMAEAFRNGNLGIMDYYKMRNIQSDTAMREKHCRQRRGQDLKRHPTATTAMRRTRRPHILGPFWRKRANRAASADDARDDAAHEPHLPAHRFQQQPRLARDPHVRPPRPHPRQAGEAQPGPPDPTPGRHDDVRTDEASSRRNTVTLLSVAPLPMLLALGEVFEVFGRLLIPALIVLFIIGGNVLAYFNKRSKTVARGQSDDPDKLRARRHRMEKMLGLPPDTLRPADEPKPPPAQPAQPRRPVRPTATRPKAPPPLPAVPRPPQPTAGPVAKLGKQATVAKIAKMAIASEEIGATDVATAQKRRRRRDPHPVRALLGNDKSIRQVIAASEVLNRPLALRDI